MTDAPKNPGCGTLKHGLKIGDEVHRDFELRELSTQDLFDAEEQADPDKGMKYNAALLCVQLKHIGSFTGPFTTQLIGKLKPGDFARLRAAQMELDGSGEG